MYHYNTHLNILFCRKGKTIVVYMRELQNVPFLKIPFNRLKKYTILIYGSFQTR